MIINNITLLNSIDESISKYNDQFLGKDDENKKIDFNSIAYSDDGESANIPEEILARLENFSISFIPKLVGKEETQDIIKQLPNILDTMNLKHFSFCINTKEPPYVDIDTSFLEHLNGDIENILIKGVDLSQEEPTKFEKFSNLREFKLEKCNITDPKIISNVNPEAYVSLFGNEIAPEYYNDALKLIQRSNGRVKFPNKELRKFAQIYLTRQVELSDYIGLMETIDFDSISQLTINLENEFDFENINNEQIVNMLNEKANINLKTTFENLSKLDPNSALKVPTRAIIKNASELSTEELLNRQYITTVQMSDGENTMEQQGEPYSREEYEKIRKEIDKIISQVEFPAEEDPNKEKKIFAQVYKILGQKIDYDYDVISAEGKNNEELQTTSRNLIGGLLENKCVCAGYADILRNVLACTGIYSEYVGSGPDWRTGVSLGGEHAWNLVELDGKRYWTDLTWDANNIKAGRYPLKYCLKSTQEFKHDSFGFEKRAKGELEDTCIESVSDEEQYMLFTGNELEPKDTAKKQENKNIGYLSDCIMSIASKGLTASSVRETASIVSRSATRNVIGEKRTEEMDGRA